MLAFLEAADKLGVRGSGDSAYQLARVVQIIGNYFGGTNSVGVGQLSALDGDNGTFAVNRDGGITIRKSKNGVNDWKDLDIAVLKKHEYWIENAILESVLKANQEFFKK